MVHYCCVPLCKNTHAMNGVSLHSFPKDPAVCRVWQRVIRRDEKKCAKLSKYSKVCSAHFHPNDFLISPFLKKKCLKPQAVPSVFAWKAAKGRRHLNRSSTVPIQDKSQDSVNCVVDCDATLPEFVKELDKVDTEQATTSSIANTCETPSDETTRPTCASSLEVVSKDLDKVDTEQACTSSDANTNETPSDQTTQPPSASSKEVKLYKSNYYWEAIIEAKDGELQELKLNIEKINVESHNQNLKLRRIFSFDTIMNNKELLTYYTGFDTLQMFQVYLEFIVPIKNINPTLETVEATNRRLNFITLEDEVLLVHSKLRQDLDNVDLAFRFGISKQLVGKIFTAWINYLYVRLGNLNIFPHRDIILNNCSEDFKREFPTTILILDATEVRTEIASSLVRQSQSFSTYKSNTTVKALVGTDPNGSIIFVSQLFTGSISDKEICKQSHLFDMLKEKLQCGEILPKDNIMVDKGFAIKDEIAELGLELNIPPFAFNHQFEVDEGVMGRKIASKRIVVEQAIRKIKAYKILSGTVKINNLAHLNQVFTVCSILTCFRPTTRND